MVEPSSESEEVLGGLSDGAAVLEDIVDFDDCM